MKAANVRLHLLVAMVHGIETAGALLDRLPFKAKGQGKKRFDLAIRKLFVAKYSEANKHLNLYSQLRSHLSHCMLPAKTISVLDDPSKTHLEFSESVLHISLTELYNDYLHAIELLIKEIDSGKLKNKKIMFDNLNFYAK